MALKKNKVTKCFTMQNRIHNDKRHQRHYERLVKEQNKDKSRKYHKTTRNIKHNKRLISMLR